MVRHDTLKMCYGLMITLWVRVPHGVQNFIIMEDLRTRFLNDKRLEQLKETWIKNVMKVQDHSREEAENLYQKIKPYGA